MTPKQKTVKPWSGRFSRDTDSFVEQFTGSVSFDQRLAACDIEGSLAHVRMLNRAGVLEAAETEQICAALEQIGKRIEQGKFDWKQELEDVHMNIESALVEQLGDLGKKVHTGRSRNDQVATDLRLFLRAEIGEIQVQLLATMTALVTLAEQEYATLMPGFTHLQAAQPVTFGHHMLAWFEMLKRDYGRYRDCLQRLDVLPLGSAALAGTRYPIDREYTAELLGFSAVSENSLDAVSDRDFVIEFAAACAMLMMHLSRFSEELILWMSPGFGFIDIDEAFCTGSSIMPQKKNPDVAELVRGKTGRVYGGLVALLTIMKAQPLAYNRDNQEDKEQLFDTIDTTRQCLQAYSGLLPAIQVNREVMRAALAKGHITATDLADYLVHKGLPFRDAHTITGKIVHHATTSGRTLEQLELADLQKFSDKIDSDVRACLELQASVDARNHTGGTAPARVQEAATRAREFINNEHGNGKKQK